MERVILHEDEIVKFYPDGKEFITQVQTTLDQSKKENVKWGIIHNDYNSANVLFKSKQVVSIIDFDLSCNGPLLIDVGYGAANWSTPDGDIFPNKITFDSFINGYNNTSQEKIETNDHLLFWTAFSCLSIASDLICDSLDKNEFDISTTNQSCMYKRYKYYRELMK